MGIALAILCIGAVVFLLCVLKALVNEWTDLPSGPVRVYFAKFNPSRRRGQLIEMNAESKGKTAVRSGERKAINLNDRVHQSARGDSSCRTFFGSQSRSHSSRHQSHTYVSAIA